MPVEADAETVTLECRHATVLVERSRHTKDLIAAGSPGSSLLEISRDPASITIEFPDPTTPEELIHPVLTLPISVLARWRGDLTLHAGSFFAGGRAWGVVGTREAGKSTMLASLVARGQPLLADDLLVLDRGVVHAGPACVDLRPDVAERMPQARFLGEIGDRPRYRLTTPPGPSQAPLGGFFLLGWSEDDEVRVSRLPPTEALRTIYEQEYIGMMGPADPMKILDLLQIPMWRVERPPDWSFTEEALDRVLEVATSSVPTG